MDIYFTLIDDSNRQYFRGVLPDSIEPVPGRMSIGAYDKEGYVLGAASYVLKGFEYEIDWLYVHPSARRQGIGMKLVEQVTRAVMFSEEIFPITARFEFSEEDDQMYTFFLSCKHMITTYSHERYYVTSSDIRQSSALHRQTGTELDVQMFFDRPVEEQKKILQMLSKDETYNVEDYDRWKETCVPDLCRCIFVKNNLVDLIFMQKTPDGNLELSYLYGKYPKGLFYLLSETVSNMERHFPEASLTFDAMNENSELLAKHLFPKAKNVHIYEAEF
ncbi:GNAT family N-acetyltransferase [Butyrivibrio sp. FCS014]|uniref:GNAT family N-acetyltransferase n=1 Tax=Butyrivibrio sp. FCS014 TaxID=1408304 RepID=UPI000463B141|nr:GNAT family N-acetyltransferase [Butyrivibrio sp. FCS014]